jgi:hypothetical protein
MASECIPTNGGIFVVERLENDRKRTIRHFLGETPGKEARKVV